MNGKVRHGTSLERLLSGRYAPVTPVSVRYVGSRSLGVRPLPSLPLRAVGDGEG